MLVTPMAMSSWLGSILSEVGAGEGQLEFGDS